MDERELLHEVSELRKKQTVPDDITFHICSNLSREEEGDSIINTVSLIRRLFPSDIDYHYPTFVYGQLPNITESTDAVKKIVWRNLAFINNSVSDYFECRLLTNVFLYCDNTQKSLADFLFNSSHSNIPFDKFAAKLPVKQAELFGQENSESVDFPPIFGGFNTFGISYPEQETRSYLHQYYLYSALRNSLPEYNVTKIEQCNEEAKRILSHVPIQNSRICLQEEMFIKVNADDNTVWQRTDNFWEENVEIQLHGLSDIPREDWLLKIRQRVDSLYQGRFREIGTDYFFKVESKKTLEYCNVLSSIIKQEFDRAVQNNPYTPEAQKTIVRGIVNLLQQKVLEINNLKAETVAEVSKIEREITEIKGKWNSLNIFNRIMGKDNQTLELYRDALTRLMIKKSLIPGCDFAVKLLDELIPAVSALIERCDEIQRIISDALQKIDTVAKDTDPTQLFGIFGDKELKQTIAAIDSDKDSSLNQYQRIIQCFFDKNNPLTDGDDLLSIIRSVNSDIVDEYINRKIEDCSIPPILGLSIVDRIDRYTGTIGGISGFVETLKRKSPITLSVKKTCSVASKCLLIAPELTEQIEGVEHYTSEEISHLQLLHVKYGLTLQDLDGFSGQRMFVEPSIF